MVALVSLYVMPHQELLYLSSNTLYLCKHNGDDSLHFIDLKMIQVAVAMIPHIPAIGHQGPRVDSFLWKSLVLILL